MPRLRFRVEAALVAAAMAMVTIPPAAAQPRGDTSTVYLYKGADRDQRLVEAAKKEGTLTFYTSMQTPESGPLAAAFERKYGIKVSLWRATSDQVLQRAITEARGRRDTLDVVETNAPEVEALGREQVTAEYDSPHFADFPEWALPAHHKWVSARANLWVVAFNTNKVKRAEIPATYEGFADPKWKGKIAIESTDQDWMYAVISFLGQERGMEMFRKLSAMKPDMRLGHALLAELIAAGEVPVGLTTYSGNADSVKKKGAPVDWVAVEPVVGRPQALAVAKNAPHPNAALLFVDFLLSPEGQKLLNDLDRNPASKTQTTLLSKYKYSMVDPIKWLDESAKWEKIWKDLFLPVR
ncbi:MAG: iron(III) transport system substrate-binding protein [Alphaproteobacteria bacterium]|jgi:iron(III) transport system substrate-binding protein|nr:iron(III) transport system substrate-binding protein [Alphaproteobacteria bacterium]